MTPAERVLLKTKIDIMNLGPKLAFFSKILFALKVTWSEDVPFARTDGFILDINPEVFVKLTDPERVFLLCHEAMHVALLHMFRLETRHPFIWNIAADYVINQFLNDANIGWIKGALLNSAYKGMSTEEVYEHLIQGTDSSELTLGVLGPDVQYQNKNTLSEEEQEQYEDKKEELENIIQASFNSTEIGNLPADLQRFFELRKPKVNWSVVLQRFLNSTVQGGVNWTRPNRRFKTYMPSFKRKQVGTVSFAVDTSGSISSELFNSLMTEVYQVASQIQPELIRVIQFDTEITNQTDVRYVSELESIAIKGGGGTDAREVIDNYNQDESICLVILTDGYLNADLYSHKPVIWVVYDNPSFKSSLGEVIHVDLSDIGTGASI